MSLMDISIWSNCLDFSLTYILGWLSVLCIVSTVHFEVFSIYFTCTTVQQLVGLLSSVWAVLRQRGNLWTPNYFLQFQPVVLGLDVDV